jgi:hypothetical protein
MHLLWRDAGWDDVRTVALSDMARQRAAGSAIVVGGVPAGPQTMWDVETKQWSSVMPARSLALCRTRRGNANESSAAMQQSTVVGAVPAGIEIHAQHQAKHTLHKNASWYCSGGACCMVVSSTWRRGPARRAHQHPLKSKAVPSRTHMPEVPPTIYMYSRSHA